MLEIAGSLFLLASLQRPLLRKLNTVLALKETDRLRGILWVLTEQDTEQVCSL